MEARGFIFGSPIALAIGAKFIPLRKPNKLPGQVISEKYVLEYGTDCLEMHTEAVDSTDRALVVDDLIATGGTLCAAINLLERVGAKVVECACVIELPELKVRLLVTEIVMTNDLLYMYFNIIITHAGSGKIERQVAVYTDGVSLNVCARLSFLSFQLICLL